MGGNSGRGAVVLTTGTFLRGLIHVGERKIPAGRMGEHAVAGSVGDPAPSSASRSGGLKTGTPPRLDGATIDWAALEMQPADDEPVPFSLLTDRITTPQIDVPHHPDRRRRRTT